MNVARHFGHFGIFGWVESNLLAMWKALYALRCDDIAGHNLQDDATEDSDGQD